MLKLLEAFRERVTHTPLLRLRHDDINLFAKLEYDNFSGSLKARAAYNMLVEAIREGYIDKDTTVIESSSGNLALALGMFCKYLQLGFVPVIDPNINAQYEKRLNDISRYVIKVDSRDETGGYLKTRINVVKSVCEQDRRFFWTNQYENVNNYFAYYKTLGVEINEAFNALDYVFIAVSSCGTITGVSRRIREKFPHAVIVAVDIEGSAIFNAPKRERHISGIGASIRSAVLTNAFIDEVMHISERDIVRGCNRLMDEHNIFAGASSGAVYAAILKYFENMKGNAKPNVLFICADSGEAYTDTIYNSEWVYSVLEKRMKPAL